MKALLPLLLVLVATPALAQRDFSTVEIRVIPVAEGVHMLVGSGGNIGVSSGPDGVLLIDDQFAPLSEKILAAVAGVSPEPVRFVLNTHWHGDHTGGNENLGKRGAVIVAHDNVRARMATEQVMAIRDQKVPASPSAALPVVTFNDSLTFHWNGVEIHAFHVDPAHTDGDAIVHLRGRNVVHMGDTFFNGLYPFIDVDSGGSITGVIAAAELALALCDDATKIIPGHGPLTDRAGLAAYLDLLRSVKEAVGKELAAGKTVDEVVAAKPTAAFDEKWGGGFLDPDTFTRIVYADLSRNR